MRPAVSRTIARAAHRLQLPYVERERWADAAEDVDSVDDLPEFIRDKLHADLHAFHLAGKHNQATHGHGGAHEMFASTADHEATLKLAREKVRNAPVPTQAQVTKARAELEKAKRGEGRAGGDSRGGSSADRRKQRENLFKEFGGNEKGHVTCHGCGLKMHHADPGSAANPKGYARLERGKIFTKCQGGGYQLPNLLPECFGCNRSRNDTPVRKENKC